jgi:hypothetical protein
VAAPSRRRFLAVVLAFAAISTATSGCTRAIQVGSEPAPVYRLVVANDLPEAMIVAYNDGRGDRTLGSVPAGRSDTFVVAGSASPAITVTARNAQGSRTAGPFSVQLVPGSQVTVRLR